MRWILFLLAIVVMLLGFTVFTHYDHLGGTVIVFVGAFMVVLSMGRKRKL